MLLLILPALAALSGCSRSAPEPPNLLLITFDTIRADHLGCYGYFRDTSPALDALAEESILFERCFAPMATTLPSHTSLFTGTYPDEHGILANIKHGGLRFESSPLLRPLAELATEAGYRTAAFVSAAPVKRETGMARGFALFDEPEGVTRSAAETCAPLHAWLDGDPGEPWFCWAHFFDTHFPYEPPPPYDAMFRTDGRLGAFLEERAFPETATGRAGKVHRTREVQNLYDGEVRFVDDQIGTLLDRLRGSVDWDRTIVVVVGDHGEGLAQHGELGHGSIWGEQLRVPLVVRVPGTVPRRETAVLSLVDVVPTLLGLAPALPFGAILDQASGVDALGDVPANRFVFSRDSALDRPDRRGGLSVLTGVRWKYIHDPGDADRLFDLEADPFELNDLVDERKEDAARLNRVLLEEVRRQAKRGAILSGAAGREAAPMDPALLEELRGLGY